MVGGLGTGLALNAIGVSGAVSGFLVDGVFHAGGAIFLASLKLLVVPLVFVSLVCGTAALDDVTRLGRVGGKTLLLYIATTAVAISWALLGAVLLRPGEGFGLTSDATFVAKQAPPLV
jgi:Na+/H+-dicarboxylate symporter